MARAHVLEVQSEQRNRAREVRNCHSILVENLEAHQQLLNALDGPAAKLDVSEYEVPKQFATHLLESFNGSDTETWEKRVASAVVESLWFRDMPTRHRTIPTAYKATFEWMYRKPRRIGPNDEWEDFVDWLHNDGNMY